MRFAALLLATVWALGCSLAVPCPKPLRWYFASEVLHTIATQPFLSLYGETSLAYALAYYVTKVLILAAALNLAVSQSVRRRWSLIVGAIVAAIVAGRAWAGMPHPLHAYSVFSIFEGGLLADAGTILIFSAAYLSRKADSLMREVALALSLLWLALAWFRMGFTMSVPSETWLKLNEVLPTLFVCAALGWSGLKLTEIQKPMQRLGGTSSPPFK